MEKNKIIQKIKNCFIDTMAGIVFILLYLKSSGFACRLFEYPFDTIKVLQQLNPVYYYYI